MRLAQAVERRSRNSGLVAHRPIDCDGVVLRPTTEDDLPTLRMIFTDPGVYEQWDGSPKGDDEIVAKYVGRRSPNVECFIVEESERTIGFVQYHVADGSDGGGMDLVLLPAERGRGFGSKVVQGLVRYVVGELGWRRFTVDPDVSNARGVNFWTRVGFTPIRVVDDGDAREPYWLMEWPI